ncbi:hypothetical protein [Roseibium aggregatum]|uniref:Uncharacterized protein n=1 Tax=Roseibium aggregatum TaxID=187304 RepID=A0A939J1Y3_9HYPH|nr:hypothetical protein [Roseibium aggregatum]MBN9670843.1 hypothetical protein [Roseibium aggregatum]
MRDLLRKSTKKIHQMAESSMTAGPSRLRANYEKFQTANAMVVPPFEAAVKSKTVIDAVPFIDERWRAGALLGNHDHLGMKVPACKAMNFVPDRASVAGDLCALEGSRLGFKFILRQLNSPVSILLSRFLSPGAGRHLWNSFVQWLNRQNWTSGEISTTRVSALSIFNANLSACDDRELVFG